MQRSIALNAGPIERDQKQEHELLVSQAAPDEATLGLRHAHGRETTSTIGDLRRAHRALHWDTTISRILRVEYCGVCGEYYRQTIEECRQADCRDHRICEARFR
jgi:hypothetical protein